MWNHDTVTTITGIIIEVKEVREISVNEVGDNWVTHSEGREMGKHPVDLEVGA